MPGRANDQAETRNCMLSKIYPLLSFSNMQLSKDSLAPRPLWSYGTFEVVSHPQTMRPKFSARAERCASKYRSYNIISYRPILPKKGGGAAMGARFGCEQLNWWRLGGSNS